MATKKQKEELIKVLKFTPHDINISLSGYGGEIVVGTVERNAYDYFQENDIDLDEFSNDWDNETSVPEDCQPFSPGEWHDCDNLAHETGVEMSELCYITVTNTDTRETLFEAGLDPDSLEELGVKADCCDEVYAEHHKGTPIFVGQSVEKGTFFDGTVRITEPFDPKKLSLTYSDIEGWLLCSTVEYDGESVEGMDGYSTTGKSMEYTLKCIDEE